MKKIDSIELGGTLFIPATHKDLLQVVSGEKYPHLKSVLVDSEDSICDSELSQAIESIKKMLKTLQKSAVLVFLRPRNIEILQLFLTFDGIEKIDAFILPKFSLSNADSYLNILEDSQHLIMPSIEGSELFEQSKLIDLKIKLLPYQHKILLIRFGLEDMLRQLKMKRKCEDSIFDFSVTNSVLGNFIAIFKSADFEISGGVYPCFKDADGFIKDVQRDLKEGLFSKTIIHPNQIEIINELYKVTQDEFEKALELIESKTALFNQNDIMAEKTTMTPSSKTIVKRAEVYGLA